MGPLPGLVLVEISVMAVGPLCCFPPRGCARTGGQWTAAALGVFGVVFNRIDTGGLAHLRAGGGFYFPSWTR